MNNSNLALKIIGIIFIIFSISYIGVPLYQLFCQTTGYGGTITRSVSNINTNTSPIPILINFTSEVDPNLPIDFKENQSELLIIPGDTTLAFYTSTNKTNEIIYGISTYNVTPSKAGIYFNKIECFCFDEQRWKPHESIEMPILFYIDPLILNEDIKQITISYTFFKSINTP